MMTSDDISFHLLETLKLEEFPTYSSCITYFGRPIIPPLLTQKQKEEARALRQAALNVEVAVSKRREEISKQKYNIKASGNNVDLRPLQIDFNSTALAPVHQANHDSSNSYFSQLSSDLIYSKDIFVRNDTQSGKESKLSNMLEEYNLVDSHPRARPQEDYLTLDDIDGNSNTSFEDIRVLNTSTPLHSGTESVNDETDFNSLPTVICTGMFPTADTDTESLVTQSTDLEKYMNCSVEFSSPDFFSTANQTLNDEASECTSSSTVVNTSTPCATAVNKSVLSDLIPTKISPRRTYSVDSFMKLVKDQVRRSYAWKSCNDTFGDGNELTGDWKKLVVDDCKGVFEDRDNNYVVEDDFKQRNVFPINDPSSLNDDQDLHSSAIKPDALEEQAESNKKHVRRNSYTLDGPSPVLLKAHESCSCKQDLEHCPFQHSFTPTHADDETKVGSEQALEIVSPSGCDTDQSFSAINTDSMLSPLSMKSLTNDEPELLSHNLVSSNELRVIRVLLDETSKEFSGTKEQLKGTSELLNGTKEQPNGTSEKRNATSGQHNETSAQHNGTSGQQCEAQSAENMVLDTNLGRKNASVSNDGEHESCLSVKQSSNQNPAHANKVLEDFQTIYEKKVTELYEHQRQEWARLNKYLYDQKMKLLADIGSAECEIKFDNTTGPPQEPLCASENLNISTGVISETSMIDNSIFYDASSEVLDLEAPQVHSDFPIKLDSTYSVNQSPLQNNELLRTYTIKTSTTVIESSPLDNAEGNRTTDENQNLSSATKTDLNDNISKTDCNGLEDMDSNMNVLQHNGINIAVKKSEDGVSSVSMNELKSIKKIVKLPIAVLSIVDPKEGLNVLMNVKKKSAKDSEKDFDTLIKKLNDLQFAFLVKGFLIRLLFNSERVLELKKTLTDAACTVKQFSDELTTKGKSVTVVEANLHRQMTALFFSSLKSFQDIFFEYNTTEKMKVIKESRDIRRKRKLTDSTNDMETADMAESSDSTGKPKQPPTSATVKYIERKRSSSDSRTEIRAISKERKCCKHKERWSTELRAASGVSYSDHKCKQKEKSKPVVKARETVSPSAIYKSSLGINVKKKKNTQKPRHWR